MSKAKQDKVPNAVVVSFVGGPREGTSLRVGTPPWRFLRLAFPEWCTYELGVDGSYHYVGGEPVPEEFRRHW